MNVQSLATPLALSRGPALPNRFAKAAMSENLASDDGAPTEVLVELYRNLARGGAGLLITGNVIVAPEGRTEPNNVVLTDDRHLEKLRSWASAVRPTGTRLWMQVSHAGRQAARIVTRRPVAPSAVPLRGMGGMFATPRPLEDAEIGELVDRFAAAAALAEAAGFHGVQLHAAHGYLISQFLSPRTNLREDKWGGSFEGRVRFLLSIVRATIAATSNDFSVAVKLNSADFQRGGFTIEESMRVAEVLEAEGVDLLEISGGTYERAAMMGATDPTAERASTREREAFFLEYAERIRERVALPLMVTGGFRTLAGMVDARATAVDVIGLARPMALEPDLPARMLAGEATSARAVHLEVGVRRLDDLLQIGWYQRQLLRIGRGQAPDPGLGRYSTIARQLLSASGRLLVPRGGA
jgi:2,4-dienoyl-CoA reductase-like NADH-dependent reductase (Old Yellow Enzyme family)